MRGLSASAILFTVAALGCGGCKKPGSEGLPSGATAVPSSAPPLAPAPPPLALSGSSFAAVGGLFSFAPIAKAADPSVVTINTVGEELERSLFSGRERRHLTKGLGTGFIVDKDGVVL